MPVRPLDADAMRDCHAMAFSPRCQIGPASAKSVENGGDGWARGWVRFTPSKKHIVNSITCDYCARRRTHRLGERDLDVIAIVTDRVPRPVRGKRVPKAGEGRAKSQWFSPLQRQAGLAAVPLELKRLGKPDAPANPIDPIRGMG
jgi:hypothetical protein